MPKLLVTGPDNITREYEIVHEMTLGRHAGNDININEEKASRRHCRFRPEKNNVFVEDLQSSNGTRILGRKIDLSHQLQNGETITIGKHIIIFQDESEPEKFDRTIVLPDEQGNLMVGMKAVSETEINAKLASKSEAAPEKKPSGKKVELKETRDEEPNHDDHTQAKKEDLEDFTHSLNAATLKILTLVALIAVFVATVAFTVSRSRSPIVAESPTTTPKQLVPPTAPVELPPVQPPVDVVPIEPIVTPKTTLVAPVVPPPRAKPADAAVSANFTKALAERDRSIASGNFGGARAALNGFLTSHPNGDTAPRARQELQDTEKIIEASLDLILKEAQRAAGIKKYRLVTQHCTRLLSSDPGGKFGNAAREILTKVDETSEARFNETQQKSNDWIKAGQLDKAGETLEKALDELGGTKWAEQVSAKQLQVLMAQSVLRQLETERAAKEKATGKPVPITLATKKLSGQFVRVNGLSLEIKSGPINLSVPIKDLPPADLQALLKSMNVSGKNLELAYLWVLLDKPANAQAELEAALQNPEQAGSAMRLVSLLPHQKNLKIYDFSKWQHQTDWDAQSGNWSTQNDRYVLDSAEGGDTMLKPEVTGGAFAAKNARISFQFELIKPNVNYFLAFELGDEQRAVSAIFSAQGLSLHANLNGGQDEKSIWAPGPTHVDLSILGNSLSVSINGGTPKKLDVDGLSGLKGNLSFRVRESACAIDNVIIRNVD